MVWKQYKNIMLKLWEAEISENRIKHKKIPGIQGHSRKMQPSSLMDI